MSGVFDKKHRQGASWVLKWEFCIDHFIALFHVEMDCSMNAAKELLKVLYDPFQLFFFASFVLSKVMFAHYRINLIFNNLL